MICHFFPRDRNSVGDTKKNSTPLKCHRPNYSRCFLQTTNVHVTKIFSHSIFCQKLLKIFHTLPILKVGAHKQVLAIRSILTHSSQLWCNFFSRNFKIQKFLDATLTKKVTSGVVVSKSTFFDRTFCWNFFQNLQRFFSTSEIIQNVVSQLTFTTL